MLTDDSIQPVDAPADGQDAPAERPDPPADGQDGHADLAPSKRVGTTIAGRYRLTKLIGIGGAGAVYAAEHLITTRVVAVKLLLRDRNVPASTAARFVRESRAAAQIGHEFIIDILDAGQDTDGSHFIVMELLQGEDLADLLERRGALTVKETVDLVADVLEALGAAHEHGLVHRDIKPGNIFLATTPGGRPRTIVLDFGIAKQNSGDTTGITRKGTTVGTPVYMSPEQVRGGPPDLRTDIWAVGVLLYQCLSGTVPFDDLNIHKLWGGILRNDHVPLMERETSIPDDLSKVVDCALSKDPDKRFRCATDMRDALLRSVGRPQDTDSSLRILHAPTGGAQAVSAAPAVSDQAGPSTTQRTRLWELAPPGDATPRRSGRRMWMAACGLLLLPGLAFLGFSSPGDPNTILLKFAGLPDDAHVFVDGQEVDVDGLRWPLGHAPITVAAEARGYDRRQLLITPDVDKTVRLSLEASRVLIPPTPKAALAGNASEPSNHQAKSDAAGDASQRKERVRPRPHKPRHAKAAARRRVKSKPHLKSPPRLAAKSILRVKSLSGQLPMLAGDDE